MAATQTNYVLAWRSGKIRNSSPKNCKFFNFDYEKNLIIETTERRHYIVVSGVISYGPQRWFQLCWSLECGSIRLFSILYFFKVLKNKIFKNVFTIFIGYDAIDTYCPHLVSPVRLDPHDLIAEYTRKFAREAYDLWDNKGIFPVHLINYSEYRYPVTKLRERRIHISEFSLREIVSI